MHKQLSARRQARHDYMEEHVRARIADVEAYAAAHPDDAEVKEYRTGSHKRHCKKVPTVSPQARA